MRENLINLQSRTGQVIALFIVGLSEYAVVWLGTDWEKEIQRGFERNQAEAKRRQMYDNDSDATRA